MVDIRQLIFKTAASVSEEQHKPLGSINESTAMLESGLDSLCIAILIAQLDDELNVSPFLADDASIPVTYGDLIGIYERATAQT